MRQKVLERRMGRLPPAATLVRLFAGRTWPDARRAGTCRTQVAGPELRALLHTHHLPCLLDLWPDCLVIAHSLLRDLSHNAARWTISPSSYAQTLSRLPRPRCAPLLVRDHSTFDIESVFSLAGRPCTGVSQVMGADQGQHESIQNWSSMNRTTYMHYSPAEHTPPSR